MFGHHPLEKINDPFEFKSLYINKEKIQSRGLPAGTFELLSSLKESVRDSLLLASFSEVSAIESLPMWAHYANNHQGYCVIYQVDEPRQLYPVFYEKQPIDATELYLHIARALVEERSGKNASTQHELIEKHLLFAQLITKQIDWSYEKELRVFAPKGTSNSWKQCCIGRGRPTNKVCYHRDKLFRKARRKAKKDMPRQTRVSALPSFNRQR